jgi:hypothetical protein
LIKCTYLLWWKINFYKLIESSRPWSFNELYN